MNLNHLGATAYLPVQSLQHAVGTDLPGIQSSRCQPNLLYICTAQCIVNERYTRLEGGGFDLKYTNNENLSILPYNLIMAFKAPMGGK